MDFKVKKEHCIKIIMSAIKIRPNEINQIKKYAFCEKIYQDIWNELVRFDLLNIKNSLLFKKVKFSLQCQTIDLFLREKDFSPRELAESFCDRLLCEDLLIFSTKEKSLIYLSAKND